MENSRVKSSKLLYLQVNYFGDLLEPVILPLTCALAIPTFQLKKQTLSYFSLKSSEMATDPEH